MLTSSPADRDVAAAYLAAGVRASSRCAAAALCGHGAYLGAPNLVAMETHVSQARALRAVIQDLQEATP